jgi:hypothetical protein
MEEAPPSRLFLPAAGIFFEEMHDILCTAKQRDQLKKQQNQDNVFRVLKGKH